MQNNDYPKCSNCHERMRIEANYHDVQKNWLYEHEDFINCVKRNKITQGIMITESKKIEFWNFLTAEKNQPRPKGITVHQLAMLKPAILGSDELWQQIIESSGAANRSASEFYQSDEASSVDSRAVFWGAVRKLMSDNEIKRSRANKPARAEDKSRQKSVSRTGRRKRF